MILIKSINKRKDKKCYDNKKVRWTSLFLNERIAELREELNLTQDDLAKTIHVVRSTISGYENGTSQPSYSVLIQLADFFNVSLDYLFDRTSFKNSTRILEGQLKGEKLSSVLDELFTLNGEDKDIVIHMVRALSNSEKYKNSIK